MALGPKRWVGVLVLVLVAIVAAPVGAGSPLDVRVDSVIQASGFESAHWGLLVVDSATGRTIFERNADQMFCPASVTKLFSTAAALVDLGPEHRFKTPVVRRGEVRDGTLFGDLILVAKGDLSLGGRTSADGTLQFEDNDHSYAGGNPDASIVAGDPLAGLIHLAREVHASGIRSIKGDVLIDDRMFEHAPSTGSGPTRVAPIVINDNVIDVLVTPGSKPGEPARDRIIPESSFLTMDAQVETTGDGAPSVVVSPAGPRRFSVRGQIPVGHKPILRVSEVEEPAAFARALFIETLRNRGVKLNTSPLTENHSSELPSRLEVGALPVVAEYNSPPFREYLKVILKVSQNLHASTLPLLVAAHHGETTLAQGLKREGEILSTLGVAANSISFGGGAGGSRSDLITPRAAVTLLRAMSSRPEIAVYDAALPVLGRDGTLARAVSSESPARGHARAKTGTYWVDNALDGQPILLSKALAGYLETSTGKKRTFAFFLNNVPVKSIGGSVSEASGSAGRLLGKLCEVFYSDPSETSEPPVNSEPAKVGR